MWLDLGYLRDLLFGEHGRMLGLGDDWERSRD